MTSDDGVARAAALRETAERYRRLVDHAPVGILVHDGVTILLANQAYVAMVGASSLEQVIGLELIETVHPDERPRVRRRVQHLRSGPEVNPMFRGRILRFDGESVDVEVMATRCVFEGKDAIQAVLLDVTDRKRTEHERAILERQLQQAQRIQSVGQLAGGVAHDFNNLLQIIQSQAEIALRFANPGQRAQEAFEEILSATAKAQQLTTRLLAFGRKQTQRPRPVLLHALVEDSLRMLRRTLPETISLEVRDEAPEALVFVDAGQLDQVLVNLCLNARDAMPSGGRVEIALGRTMIATGDPRLSCGRDGGPHVQITVSDSGTGIPSDVIDQIFEPFFTTKPLGLGTGLGLPMVQGLVAQNRGFVEVESEPGSGTTVRVLLPEHLGRGVVTPPREETPPDAKSSGRGETVLVAEDSDAVRRVLVEVLESAGYRVLAVRDGVEAQEAIESSEVEVAGAILDALMPRLGGRETYESLRKAGANLPILFLSGHPADTLPDEFLQEHDLRLLAKPFAIDDLLAALRALLDGAPPAR